MYAKKSMFELCVSWQHMYVVEYLNADCLVKIICKFHFLLHV